MDSIRNRLPTAITTDRRVLTPPTMAHAPDSARLSDQQPAGRRMMGMRLEFDR